MSYSDRLEFLEGYRKLVEKTNCYIDTGYGKPLYVMTKQYPVDKAFESTFEKLEADIG